MHRRYHLITLVILVLTFLVPHTAAAAQSPTCTINWDVDADGFWDEGANWDRGTPPALQDVVCIDRPGGDYTVTIRGNAGTMTGVHSSETLRLTTASASLRIQAASETAVLLMEDGLLNFQSAGSWTIGGESRWSGGTIAVDVINTGTLTLDSPTELTARRSTFTNEGAIVHAGGDFNDSSGAGGSTIVNEAGALYDLQTDAEFIGGGHFINRGTLRKSGGSGEAIFLGAGWYLDNEEGLIDVQSGQLTWGRGASTGGTFTVADGAVLDLNGGRVSSFPVFSGSYVGSGEGLIQLVSGHVQFDNVTLDFGSGLFHWQGGRIWNNSPMVNEGAITLSGTGPYTLQGVLNNAGTIVHQGSGLLEPQPTSAADMINNLAGAQIRFEGNMDVTVEIFNEGEVQKVGAGETRIADFNNLGGELDVQAGTLNLAGRGESSGGIFHVAGGASLEVSRDLIANGIHDFTGTYTGSGEGAFIHRGSIRGDSDNPPVLNFPPGFFEWRSGTIVSGIVNEGTITLSGSEAKVSRGQWTNNGDFIHRGSGSLQLAADSSFTNNGLYDFQSDANLEIQNSATLGVMIFTNNGVLQKSGGAGTTAFVDPGNRGTLRLDNEGQVVVAGGELLFDEEVAQVSGDTLTAGEWRVDANASLTLSAYDSLSSNEATVVLGGSGATFSSLHGLAQNSGSLTLGGGAILTTDGPFTNSGHLVIGLAGRPSSGLFGQLQVTGQATLGGGLHVTLQDGFVPLHGDSYPIITHTGAGGTFDMVTGLEPYFSLAYLSDSVVLKGEGVSADLAAVANSITFPSSTQVGQEMTVSYQINNLSDTTLDATWIDSLYLSGDTIYDPGDTLLGRVTHTGGVNATDSYQEALTAQVPGLLEGDYYVIVIADSRHFVSDENYDNNYAVAPTPLRLTFPELQLGVAQTGTIVDDKALYYRLDLPAGQDVLLTAQLQAGWQAELYAGYGVPPDRNQYTWTAPSYAGTEQQILITSPFAGVHYVLLHGLPGAGDGAPFTLKAEALPFVLLHASPQAGGNVGRVTVMLEGAGFSANTAVTMRDGNNLIATATEQVISSNRLLATFNLDGVAQGLYDLRAVDGPDSHTLDDAFTVNAGQGGDLNVDLVLPAAVRSQIPFRGTVFFANDGDVDIPVELMRLAAPEGGSLWPENLEPEEAAASLQFLTVPTDAVSGGVLAPGQQGRFDFWATIPADGDTTFTLNVATTPAATAVDYDAIRATIRPADPPTLWDDAYETASASMGATHGAYLDSVITAVDEARQYGLGIQSLREVWGYLIQHAVVNLPGADLRGTVTVLQGGLHLPLARGTIALERPPDPQDSGQDSPGVLSRTWYDGSFALRGLPPGSYDVVVEGHYSPDPDTITVTGAPLENVSILVARGTGIVHGYVRDADNVGVPDVRLTARSDGGEILGQVESDWLGYYRIDGLPTAGAVTLSATPTEHVLPPQKRFDSGNEPFTVNFSLDDGGGMSGTVRLPGGQAAPGATVRAGNESQQKTVVANANGEYLIEGLPSGEYTLAAWLAGYGPVEMTGVAVADETTTSGVNLTLSEAGSSAMQVSDGQSSQPVAGAQVMPIVPGAEPVLTAANGAATLADLPPGDVEVQIRSNGYLFYTTTVTVNGGVATPLDVALTPAGSIAGSVTGSGLGPLAGIPVTVVGDGTAFPTTTYTNGGGQFSFVDAADGDYYVALGDNVAAAIGRQSLTIDPGNKETMVTFNRNVADLSGRVLVPGGTPVGGALVELVHNGETVAAGASDDAGAFRFIVLEAGTYDLVASHLDYGIQRRSDVAVSLGAVLEDQDIAVAGDALNVQVSGPGGAVRGAQVIVAQEGVSTSALAVAETDGGGVATFPHLAQGDYQVTVRAAGYAWAVESVLHNSSATNLPVTLEANGTVSGVVEMAGGAPVRGAQLLFIEQGDARRYRTFTQEDGGYLANTVPAGIYDLWITSPGREFQPTKIDDITVSGAASLVVNATVATGGATLSGMITSEGTAVDVARVLLLDGDDVLLTTSTDYSGAYRLENLPAGNFTLRVERMGFQRVDTNVSIAGGGDATQDVALGAAQAFTAVPPAQGQPSLKQTSGALQQVVNNDGGTNISSWLTNGMPPPTQAGIHESFVMPLPPTGVSSDLDQAYVDLLLAKVAADEQFYDWQSSYENMASLNQTNAGLIAAQSTALAGKAAALGVALNAASGGTATLTGAGAIGTGYAFGGLVSNLTNALMGGDFDTAAATLDTMDLFLSEAASSLGEKGGSQAVAGLGLYKDATELLAGIRGVANDAAALQSTTAQSQDLYNQRIERLIRARQRYYDLLQNDEEEDDDGSPQEPPEQEDEEQVDEEEPDRQASRDPNDITGPDGYGPQHWLQPIPTFAYTIQFENVATASAPAQEVLITQALDPDLDWTTFELGDFGFGPWTFSVPPGRKYFAARLDSIEELGFFVDFEAKVNLVTGVATWRLTAVDPATGDLIGDPSAGFLPPNETPPEGEGFVDYRIRPLPNLPTGTQVRAQASIIFDINEPIVTPVYVNTIDRTPPQAGVDALPATTSSPQFTVSWSGSDANGSGIAAYDLFVAENGGPYTPWQTSTTATAATFEGQSGATYRFYAVATDNVGLRRPAPNAAQTMTTVGYTLHLPVVNRR